MINLMWLLPLIFIMVLIFMVLYSRKVQRDIEKLEKESDELNTKLKPYTMQPRQHGKTIAQRKALHRTASHGHSSAPQDDGGIISPLTVLVGAAIISANDIPDCAPQPDSSYDSGSCNTGGGSDSGGSDFGGGN